ncbi:hypothetical protein EDD22DRAFT_849050 [Suillus occidentalis]|nr:hypothetical protein EDD22DRAFT_849050 [Suillus occidentalis]
MSVSPFPELLDAPMHDFATEIDVPMNPAAAQEFFVELSMDHDGHHTTYNQEDVEVDMETYYDGNAEYEMADETEEFNESHYHHEPLDVEVYDVSGARSPQPIPDSHLSPSLIINQEISLLSSPVPFSDPFTPRLATISVEHDTSTTDRPVESDHPVAEEAEFSALKEKESLALTLEQLSESDPLHLTATADRTAAELNVSSVAPAEPHGTEKNADALVLETTDRAGSSVQPTEAEPTFQTQVEETLYRSDVPSDDSAQPQGETHPEGLHEEADNANDPHEISDGVYIDPPPAVFLSIGSSEVPEYCLFNQPPVEHGSRSPSAGASNQQAYALLLENRPTLYYEPLSCVFEALRQDEVISRIPDSFEGELVMDAYDLQLAVLELQALMKMLQQKDTFLQCNMIPRQKQITTEEEAQLDADHHEEEDADHHEAEARHEALLHDQKDPDRAESAQEPNVPLDQLRGDDALAKDVAFIPQAVADVAYHSVSGDIIQALEEEDDYEGKNVGTEYPEDGDGDHDTAAVHQTSEIDPAETVSNANVQFGGKETEYQDYMQPGEYGDIYEDFPEEDSTHTEFGFDQTVGYDESRTEAVSSTVEESQAGLPESDLHEEDTTPVPLAQQIDSEPARRSEAKDSVFDDQGDPLASYESFEEEKSSHGTDKDQDTDQPESSAQFPTDESDFNLLAMLEREADFELDHSSSHTNADPAKEGGGQTFPVLEEEWDNWDDELDGDGEIDDEWLDPGDAVSNESSVTLSSNSSAKRRHDAVDPDEVEPATGTPHSSPGKFRVCVMHFLY